MENISSGSTTPNTSGNNIAGTGGTTAGTGVSGTQGTGGTTTGTGMNTTAGTGGTMTGTGMNTVTGAGGTTTGTGMNTTTGTGGTTTGTGANATAGTGGTMTGAGVNTTTGTTMGTGMNAATGAGGTTTGTGMNATTGTGGTMTSTGTNASMGIGGTTAGAGVNTTTGTTMGTGMNTATGAGGTTTGTGTNATTGTQGTAPSTSINITTSPGAITTRAGGLKIQCFRGDDYIPIDRARITVRGTSGTGNVGNIELITNTSGLTDVIELPAPPLEYSLNPNSNQTPYSLYDITIEREGFNPIAIRGCQVFPTEIAYQICNLEVNLARGPMRQQVIDILPNTLNGDFPPKIPEDPEKPLPPPTSGVVLPQPVVPEFVIVHQGGPNDPSAPNYKVPFKDYIKNVASCEIYSTWTESAIRANIFCIVSFTLNRIFTEWYRGKGKNFDITSSTAYDQAFNYGRNIYDNISQIVDEIFSTYVRRIGRKQPLFTQYCDGKSVTCPQWLSQWGSQELGRQGRVPYDILRYYYGNDIELTTAEKVSGIPISYPGYELKVGSSGPPVRAIQGQLNRIARNYPLIPKLAEDGKYGPKTAQSVKTFQQIFTLPQTGVVDYATWYRISDIYVGVTRLAELNTPESSRSFRGNVFIPPVIPGFEDERDIPRFYY